MFISCLGLSSMLHSSPCSTMNSSKILRKASCKCSIGGVGSRNVYSGLYGHTITNEVGVIFNDCRSGILSWPAYAFEDAIHAKLQGIGVGELLGRLTQQVRKISASITRWNTLTSSRGSPAGGAAIKDKKKSSISAPRRERGDE